MFSIKMLSDDCRAQHLDLLSAFAFLIVLFFAVEFQELPDGRPTVTEIMQFVPFSIEKLRHYVFTRTEMIGVSVS